MWVVYHADSGWTDESLRFATEEEALQDIKDFRGRSRWEVRYEAE